MKRTWMTLALAAISLAALSGCGQEPQAPVEETNWDKETILEEMFAANQNDALMDRHDSFALEVKMTDKAGENYHILQYWDEDQFVTESDFDCLVQTADKTYGYTPDCQTVWEVLPPDGYGEPGFELLEEYRNSETVESIEEVGDQLVIQTSEDQIASLEEALLQYGYTLEEIQGMTYEYHLDPESLELQGYTVNLITTDGAAKVIQELKGIPEPEVYVPAAEVTDLVYSQDTRTLTVVYYPGTEEETTETYTLAKGVRANLFAPEDADPVSYLDPDCTVPMPDQEDFSVDRTVYIRKLAE